MAVHSPWASISLALELVEETRRLRAAGAALCDETRLTRAWSQELRRRDGRCAACHRQIASTEVWLTACYVPAGESLDGASARIHPRCLTLWITESLQSDSGRVP